MSACQDVRRALTEGVLVPVTQFFYELTQKCDQVEQWIEQQIQQPVEQWEAQQEQSCQALPWWNPARWLCALVTILVKVVVWVTVTVGKWTVVSICQTVTVITSVIVTAVLRTLMWPVSFFACLFTDPAQAFESFLDIFAIAFDAVGALTDLAGTLMSDAAGILDDTVQLIDSLAASLPPPLSYILGAVGSQWTRRLWITCVTCWMV